MHAPPPPIRFRKILTFWAPMAATWLMMATEGPFLAAVIARLEDPKRNLAAYGIAFAVALIVEAPIIMMLSASTALVDDARSFQKLRNFTYALNALITLLMLVLLATPLWSFITHGLIGLPTAVAHLTQGALWLLLPWPAAIGYRRFYQGLLIRNHLTRRVAYGTVVRLSVMGATCLSLFHFANLPGAWVGCVALSAGVCAESLASRIMAQQVVRQLAGAGERPGSTLPLTYRRIFHFYYPLLLTSTLAMAAHPVVTFFMGHAPASLESLAVLPVIISLAFIFRSQGLAYQEVAIALLAAGRQNRRPVGLFALLLAASVSGALALIAFTPLSSLWFRDVSGLSLELTAFALLPTRILAAMPALSVLLCLQRAILVQQRWTTPITWATLLEVAGIISVLVLTIRGFHLAGATAAAIAFLAGRLGGNLVLVAPCLRALHGRRGHPHGLAAPCSAPEGSRP
ncbi:MAG: hypothetical protein ACE5HD_06295 [Acidobacteriota bacterium]